MLKGCDLMSNIAKILGQRMKNRRVELNLSQEKLAEKAGVHPTYIGQLERGEKNVSVENVEKISQALDVSLSTLFEHLGGKNNASNDIPIKCYEFIASKSSEEQQKLYNLLLEIDKYRNM